MTAPPRSASLVPLLSGGFRLVLLSVREGGRAPLSGLPPQIQARPRHQVGHLMLAQVQPHLRPSPDIPPLASPVTRTPQLEVASFAVHCGGRRGVYVRDLWIRSVNCCGNPVDSEIGVVALRGPRATAIVWCARTARRMRGQGRGLPDQVCREFAVTALSASPAWARASASRSGVFRHRHQRNSRLGSHCVNNRLIDVLRCHARSKGLTT